ncbi:hypothetical protein KP696_19110 [Nocardia seriolae]|uniref:Uncharacterized protein n=2 Tax=Nocardia seriolae TaxID=37332 RepID=A0ABC9YLW5_9NOCA|nr:hypothetical protein [Nocardia seriolae]GEM28635.1 hypothetical protein NS2_68740 [Nocardia seriolae NBRC 15557]APB01700.1 hypothetical protein NS506_07681 [Nocardia seriolae]MTJ76125.1 hypothetical protein [Nocardia seriolae]MTJ91026.1 hypothetical protein [Nocardia seriolae]MTK51604.1 hypothetical protein [Nocardia seriolae]
MDAAYKARCTKEIAAMAATMKDDGSMHLAYIHGQAHGSMIADLPGDLASRVLTVISEVLLEAEQRGAVRTGRHRFDDFSTTANGEEVSR